MSLVVVLNCVETADKVISITNVSELIKASQ